MSICKHGKLVAAAALSITAFAAFAQTPPPPEPIEKPETENLKVKPGLPTNIPALSIPDTKSDDATDSSRPEIRVAPRPGLSTEELLKTRRKIPSLQPGTTVSSTDLRQQALEPDGPEIFAQNEVQYSAVSGTVSGNTKILDLSDTFMNTIFWREANNKPCFFQIDSLGDDASSETWSPCTGVGFAATFDTGARVSLEADTAIGRLQVCQSKSGRIKGIRVYGDRINPDGTTTYHPAISTSEFTNCKVWKQDVLCPSGTLSSGLVIHYDSGGSRPAATGLQLVCRGVGVRGNASTAKDSTTEPAGSSAPFAPILIKPQPIPLILATSTNVGKSDKSDKGNDASKTTPTVGFADGTPSFTGVSGRTGQTSSTIDLKQRGLNKIGWREKFDKACELNLMSFLKGDKIWFRLVDRCDDDPPTGCVDETCIGDSVWVNQTHRVILLGDRTAITAMRVCTNDRSNGRVKGIEVKGGEILGDATMSNIIMTSRDSLNNCRKWQALQLCPAGMAATGVRTHFDHGSGPSANVDQLVGLQLVCRKLELQ